MNLLSRTTLKKLLLILISSVLLPLAMMFAVRLRPLISNENGVAALILYGAADVARQRKLHAVGRAEECVAPGTSHEVGPLEQRIGAAAASQRAAEFVRRRAIAIFGPAIDIERIIARRAGQIRAFDIRQRECLRDLSRPLRSGRKARWIICYRSTQTYCSRHRYRV